MPKGTQLKRQCSPDFPSHFFSTCSLGRVFRMTAMLRPWAGESVEFGVSRFQTAFCLRMFLGILELRFLFYKLES